MTIRTPAFVLASLLAGGLLRAEPDHGSAAPHGKHDVSVSIHGSDVDIDGILDTVDDKLDAALDSLDRDDIPPALRAKLKERIGKVRASVRQRLHHLDTKNLDQLGKQLDEMGKDLDRDMQGLGSDLADLHIDVDLDKPDLDTPDFDDDDDVADAVRDLGDLKLQPAQRAQIQKLRADSDAQVAAARKALATASKALHDQLADGKASDADIARAIDSVSAQEAAIRKARILAWVSARRVLDDSQRKRVEDAARGKTK